MTKNPALAAASHLNSSHLYLPSSSHSR